MQTAEELPYGVPRFIWCFTNDRNCYYMIDRSRGSPALQQFFTEEFNGVLITDFWAAYQSVCAEDRQYCLVVRDQPSAMVQVGSGGSRPVVR